MIRACVIGQEIDGIEVLQRRLERSGILQVAHTGTFDTDIVKILTREPVDVLVIDAAVGEETALVLSGIIMRLQPLPVVLFTDEDRLSPLREKVEAADIGVLGVLHFPASDPLIQEDVIRHLVLLSEVKVVRRWDGNKYEALSKPYQNEHQGLTASIGLLHEEGAYPPMYVVIGASAGGTKALEKIVSSLSGKFPIPILVVQHLAPGYVEGFARWLGNQTSLQVKVAENQEMPQAGWLYLAPDERHLTVSIDNRIVLRDDVSVNGFKPSIGSLFSSVLGVCGGRLIAVLLSGMGADGALEMRTLFDAGAVTIAQDRATSLIHGIPGEAIKLGAARLILPLEEIAPALISLSVPRPEQQKY